MLKCFESMCEAIGDCWSGCFGSREDAAGDVGTLGGTPESSAGTHAAPHEAPAANQVAAVHAQSAVLLPSPEEVAKQYAITAAMLRGVLTGIESDADINWQKICIDGLGDVATGLPLAIQALMINRVDLAKEFIELRAKVNGLQRTTGKTLLMYALAKNFPQFAADLIKRGADVRAMDDADKTVLQYAQEAHEGFGGEELGRVLLTIQSKLTVTARLVESPTGYLVAMQARRQPSSLGLEGVADRDAYMGTSINSAPLGQPVQGHSR